MSDHDQLTQQLKNAKELVERRDLALKLGQNRDFKKLILEDFCVKEAARLVGQSADPVLQPQERADALSMAQSAGHLKRYLQMMVMMGNSAEREIPQIEAMLVEIANDPEGEYQELDGSLDVTYTGETE